MMQRHYFNKLLIQITFMVTLIILILTIVLYFNFKSYSLDVLYRSNEKLLHQVFENALQTNESIENYANTFWNHPAAVELLNATDIPILNRVNDLKSLDVIMSAVPLIHSVYLYNAAAIRSFN